jgi:hypothetical protein
MSSPPNPKISDPGPRIFFWAGLLTGLLLIWDGIAGLTGDGPSRLWDWLDLGAGGAMVWLVFHERRKAKS